MNEIETLPENKTKKYGLIIGGLIIIIALAFGVLWAMRPAKEVVKTADLHLDTAQQEQRNSLIEGIQNQIVAAEAKNVSIEERFKLYSQLGNEQYAIGAYDAAQKALVTAQKLLPDNPTSYQDLYRVYFAMHDYDAALSAIKRAVELNSASVANWNNYITLEKNQFGMSTADRLKLFEQAVTKTAQAPEIVHAYAETYEEKGDYVQAYNIYRTLVDKYPNNAQYHADIDRMVSKQNTNK